MVIKNRQNFVGKKSPQRNYFLLKNLKGCRIFYMHGKMMAVSFTFETGCFSWKTIKFQKF